MTWEMNIVFNVNWLILFNKLMNLFLGPGDQTPGPYAY
jgi:hypothetical protein